MAPRRAWNLGCGLVLCAAALSTGACGKGSRDAATAPSSKPVTRAAPAPALVEESPRSRFDSAATDLQALFDELGSNPPPAQVAASAPAPVVVADAATQPAADPKRPDFAIDTSPAPANAAVAAATNLSTRPQPEASPEQKRVELIGQLAGMLKPGAAASKSEPVRAALPLIALELIEPGAARQEIDRLMVTLSPEEAATVGALRDLVGQIAGDSQAAGDRAALARLLEKQAERLSSVAGAEVLSLGTVALCQRVESFGRYTPFAGNRFLAGRTIAMIVYTEVKNYTQSVSGGAGNETWTVELGQELQLYTDTGGMLQWRQPELAVRDAARTRRSDYYLVQRVELPANLSVGKYNLKVIVRDKAPGGSGAGSGAVAEAIVPIEIVADASLLSSPGVPGKPLATPVSSKK